MAYRSNRSHGRIRVLRAGVLRMTRLSKRLIVILTLLPPTWLLGCSPLCNETPGGQSRSPDSQMDAITTFRDCGATTPEYTQVTLQPSPANHTDIKQVIFTARNHHEVSLGWKSASELTVSCPTCTGRDIELEIVKFRSVEVTYVLGLSGYAGRAARLSD